jgi:hypothetical protein
MAIYNFETITDAQAAGFTGNDTLIFGQSGETANKTTVRFNAATATSTATVTIISGLTGKSATFAPAVSTKLPIFTDGSLLFIGDATAQSLDVGRAAGRRRRLERRHVRR